MNIEKFLESKKLNEVLTKRLTRREVEILSLYAVGNTSKEIAQYLTVSENTVKTHIKNIFLKINIPNGANPTKTLCLLFFLFRKDITKMGGYKNAK